MWKNYDVHLKFTGKVMGGIPKDEKMIQSWLDAGRMKDSKYEKQVSKEIDGRTIEEIKKECIENAMTDDEAKEEKLWVGFLADDVGIYAREHQIKAHQKDCANQIKDFKELSKIKGLGKNGKVSAFKSKVANKVYVQDEINYFHRGGVPIKEVDGCHEHAIRIMTLQGERSALKRNDFIIKPELNFTLKVLDDGVIGIEALEKIFEYGCVHGMFSERGHGYGKYTYVITEIEEKVKPIKED